MFKLKICVQYFSKEKYALTVDPRNISFPEIIEFEVQKAPVTVIPDMENFCEDCGSMISLTSENFCCDKSYGIAEKYNKQQQQVLNQYYEAIKDEVDDFINSLKDKTRSLQDEDQTEKLQNIQTAINLNRTFHEVFISDYYDGVIVMSEIV